MRPPAFCDSCHGAIPDLDPESMTIAYGNRHIQLCATCSVVIVEMLKDLRVVKDRPEAA